MVPEKKEERKGGFLGLLSQLFGGSSSGMGGATGLGGIFATKAGIMGAVLGGATIAAGVGVVYNFIGPSSNQVYTPQLFQESYYEEEAQKASMERAQANQAASAPSTLDMFRDQAKKEGLAGLASEGAGSPEGGEDPEAKGGAADGSDAAAEGDGKGSSGASAPEKEKKLQAAAGFGSLSSKTSAGGGMPKLQSSGGMFNGIGSQFQKVYRPSANTTASASAMRGSMAARVANSPKYSVPNFNRKGAYGQAKFAGKLGARAAYSSDGSGARAAATEAFSGETGGSGDVGSGASGVGLGGAGVSNGANLANNDPNMDTSEVDLPEAEDASDESPWQSLLDIALYGTIAAIAFIMGARAAYKAAISTTPAGAFLMGLAKVLAALAMAAAAMVMYAGVMLFKAYDQKWTGGVYAILGGILEYMAITAYMSFNEPATSDGVKDAAVNKGGASNANSAATQNQQVGDLGATLTNSVIGVGAQTVISTAQTSLGGGGSGTTSSN